MVVPIARVWMILTFAIVTKRGANKMALLGKIEHAAVRFSSGLLLNGATTRALVITSQRTYIWPTCAAKMVTHLKPQLARLALQIIQTESARVANLVKGVLARFFGL
jgi:hypothetical protein